MQYFVGSQVQYVIMSQLTPQFSGLWLQLSDILLAFLIFSVAAEQ